MQSHLYYKNSDLLITCAKAVTPWLAEEIQSLGYHVTEQLKLGVFTRGTFSDAILLNLKLRTAYRVLLRLDSGRAKSPGDLYRAVKRIKWEDYLHVDGYVCVTSSVKQPMIRDTRFANLKTKDAIVDRMKEVYKKRPDSGPERDRAVVFVYWQDDQYSVFLDTTGEPLSKRGYRKIPLRAPMQETLAAAVLAATGWAGKDALVNPMCGSGTLGIEAALRALNKAPALTRSHFAFQHIKGFTGEHYHKLCLSLQKNSLEEMPGRIILSDHDKQAVRAAQKNAAAAGVEHLLEFHVCDFAETPVPPGNGIVVLNPGYGVRLQQQNELEQLYKRIGDFMKQRCPGYTGYVFTGNLQLIRDIGLKPSRKYVFFNGDIESRLLKFDLYSGSRRTEKTSGESGD